MISLAVLATLVAAFYTEEDRRGKRAWENCKRQLEAKGEKLDWQAFVPPAVPDDQNFFTAPIITNLLNGKITMTPYGSDGGPDFLPGARQTGYAVNQMYRTDLETWQNYYRNPTNIHVVVEDDFTNGITIPRTNYLNHATDGFPIAPQPQTPAKDVLFALSKFDSAVEELRQASLRPAARLPLNFDNSVEDASKRLSWLAQEKRTAQLLELRAIAELQDNQSETALQDVQLFLRLIDTIRKEPDLISHLVRIAMQAIATHPIYEGLAQHRWNDEQLASLESALGKKDYLTDFQSAMRGERSYTIARFELESRTREMKNYAEKNGDEILVTNSLRWMPSAYFYQNQLAFARLYEQLVLPLVDVTNHTVSVATYRADGMVITNMMKHFSPYTAQAPMSFHSLCWSVQKFAVIQSQVDLARVACALERYRLAHGEYPETLDALAPQFIEKLPHDIVNGQPLHYRRTDDPPSPGSGAAGGKFVLYSVGWNETDDGGTVALTSGGSVDRTKGDWVWQYPPK